MDDVRRAVDANEGVLTVTMVELRDAYGAGRLGWRVRDGISKDLHGHGLAHYPVDLPDSQERPVRLYKLGSPVQDLIDAVLNPDAADNFKDEQIRRAVSGREAELLRRVRELLCS